MQNNIAHNSKRHLIRNKVSFTLATSTLSIIRATKFTNRMIYCETDNCDYIILTDELRERSDLEKDIVSMIR